MARPGVTYHDVALAAAELQGQGKYPTIESVRACLGTGSSSTIGPHLRAWRAKQDSGDQIAAKENLPSELVALVKGLWERVVHLADEKIAFIQQQCEQETQQAHTETQQLQQANKEWQQRHHLLQQEKEQLLVEKTQADQTLVSLQKEQAALLGKYDTLTQQLEEKQVRIEELHQLHHQVQTNLEHYREAAREQRLLDQQKFEQREQQLEQSVHQLGSSLKAAEKDKIVLEQRCTVLLQEKETLSMANEKHLTQLEKMQQELAETAKKCSDALSALQHTREQYQVSQQKLAEEVQSAAHLQTQTALLSQALSQAKDELSTLSGQHTALTHEKWYIMQEKSQLEGQLQQLDKLLHRQGAGLKEPA